MTLTELKNEVCSLGFEDSLSLDENFIFCARRALFTVYTERGVHKTLTLYQNLPLADFHEEKIFHRGGEEETYAFDSGAFSLCACGSGTIRTEDAAGRREQDFSSEHSIIKGFIKGKGKIVFTGKGSYTVFDLTHFDMTFEDNVSAIPVFSEYVSYDLSCIADDFLAAASVATDAYDNEIIGSSICSAILKVPRSFTGKIILTYKAAPPKISADFLDEELDIPQEIAALVPLVCASYVWLDDDAEKAQYYLSLYREGMAAVKLYDSRCLDTQYTDVTGWA